MATNCKRQPKGDEVETDSHNKMKTLVKGECRKTYHRRMRPQDFQEHGFSTNCLGCEWIQNGLYGLIGYRNHTDSCRQRMDEALGIQMRIPIRCGNLTGMKESEDGQTRAKTSANILRARCKSKNIMLSAKVDAELCRPNLEDGKKLLNKMQLQDHPGERRSQTWMVVPRADKEKALRMWIIRRRCFS